MVSYNFIHILHLLLGRIILSSLAANDKSFMEHFAVHDLSTADNNQHWRIDGIVEEGEANRSDVKTLSSQVPSIFVKRAPAPDGLHR